MTEHVYEYLKKHMLTGGQAHTARPPKKSGSRKAEEFRVVDSFPRNGEGNVPENPEKFVFIFNKPVNGHDLVLNTAKHVDFGRISLSTWFSAQYNLFEIKVTCYDKFLDRGSRYSIKLKDMILSADGDHLIPYELVFYTEKKGLSPYKPDPDNKQKARPGLCR